MCLCFFAFLNWKKLLHLSEFMGLLKTRENIRYKIWGWTSHSEGRADLNSSGASLSQGILFICKVQLRYHRYALTKSSFLSHLFPFKKNSFCNAKGFALRQNSCKLKAGPSSSPLADNYLKRTITEDQVYSNGVAQENQVLIWPTGLLQWVFLQVPPCSRILLLLPSLVAKQPWKGPESMLEETTPGALCGMSFLENPQGQSGLGLRDNVSPWNDALREGWSWGKWMCNHLINRINSFTNSKLASELPWGSAVVHQFSRSLI